MPPADPRPDLPPLPDNWTLSKQGPFIVADCPEIQCRLMYAPDNDQLAFLSAGCAPLTEWLAVLAHLRALLADTGQPKEGE